MVGTFSLLVCLLLATGRLCHATLSKATSSITPKIAVGANPVISIDVTTSIQATDVRVSLNEIRFKTVEIRPSSITISDNGADSYGTRVNVIYEVLTANTNVRVKVLFTTIQKADNGLVIKFEDAADVDEKSFTLDVQYCDIAFLQPTATSVNSSITCGSGCVKQFTCNSTFKLETFTAICQDTATWNVSTAPCSKACDNSFFTKAVAVDGSIVGNGESKNFNCNCSKPVASFTRTCGPDGQWTNQTDPCSSVCNANRILCGSPVSNGLLCGGEKHEFNCTGDVECEPTTFELECQANGIWVDTTCYCGTVCSANSISCGSPVSNGLLCGGEKHEFNCTGDVECEPTTFELECQANGTWADTTCNCGPPACIADNITCASPQINGPLCGGKTHNFSHTDTNQTTIYAFECDVNGTWVSTTCDNVTATVFNRHLACGIEGSVFIVLGLVTVSICARKRDAKICKRNIKTFVIIVVFVSLPHTTAGILMILLGNYIVAIVGIVLTSFGNAGMTVGIIICCCAGRSNSPRQDGRRNTELTPQSTSGDCQQAEDTERRRESMAVSYENNEVRVYQEIRAERNEPSYQNIRRESNYHQNEAHGYTVYEK